MSMIRRSPFAVALVAATLGWPAGGSAAPLGNGSPIPWLGSNANTRLFDFRDGGAGRIQFDEDDNKGVLGATSRVETPGAAPDLPLGGGEFGPVGPGEMRAVAAPYVLRGYIAGDVGPDFASTTAGPDVTWSANAFFRDELVFSTDDGSPAIFEFDIHIAATLEVRAFEHPVEPGSYLPALGPGTSGAELNVNWAMPTEDFIPGTEFRIFETLDTFSLAIREDETSGELVGVRVTSGVESEVDLEYEGTFDEGLVRLAFDETVTFSTANLLGPVDGLVASGTHFPFSLTSFGDAANGVVDWFNTIGIEDVRVLDEQGNPLSPDIFTLTGQEEAFVPFANQGPARVSEPSGLALLATGLAALAWRTRRRGPRLPGGTPTRR